MASTPEERSLNARIAANLRWAGEPDRTAATAKARSLSPVALEYWMEKVDPERKMRHEERVKRATNARTAYYLQITRKARQAKAAKKRRG